MVARVFRYRTLKFNPRIASTLRPHGKWGDLLTCLIPVSWCLNILINSNYILKMIEWQSESSLFTLRVRAKQWYWIYKLDLRNISDVYSTPRNIGRNKWQSAAFGDLQTAEDYLHIIQMRAHKLWAKSFWAEVSKKAIKSNSFKVVNPVEAFKSEFISNATLTKQNEELKLHSIKNVLSLEREVHLKKDIKIVKDYFQTLAKVTRAPSFKGQKKNIFMDYKLRGEFLFNDFVKEHKGLKKRQNITTTSKKNNNAIQPLVLPFNKVVVPAEKMAYVHEQLRRKPKIDMDVFLPKHIRKAKRRLKLHYKSIEVFNRKYTGQHSILFTDGFGALLYKLKKEKENFSKNISTQTLSSNLLTTVWYNSQEKKISRGLSLQLVNSKNVDMVKKMAQGYKLLWSEDLRGASYMRSTKRFFNDLVLENYLGKQTKTFLKSDLDEETRILRKNFGKPTPLRVLKLPNTEVFFKDSLSGDNSVPVELLRFRFNKPISTYAPKPTRPTVYLTFKQKRYNQRLNIGVKNQTFLNKNTNINQKYSGNPFLKNNSIIEENFGNPTRQYRMIKKAKNRIDTTKVANWNRLLRSRRVLVLPAHVNITVITNSFDVVHSWHIPGLGLKMDCLPGRATHHTLHIDNVGLYYGQCAEVCGRYHHHMPIRVCALPFEHFLVWWHTFGLPKFMFNTPKDKDRKLDFSSAKYMSRRFTW